MALTESRQNSAREELDAFFNPPSTPFAGEMDGFRAISYSLEELSSLCARATAEAVADDERTRAEAENKHVRFKKRRRITRTLLRFVGKEPPPSPRVRTLGEIFDSYLEGIERLHRWAAEQRKKSRLHATMFSRFQERLLALRMRVELERREMTR